MKRARIWNRVGIGTVVVLIADFALASFSAIGATGGSTGGDSPSGDASVDTGTSADAGGTGDGSTGG